MTKRFISPYVVIAFLVYLTFLITGSIAQDIKKKSIYKEPTLGENK